MPEPLKLTRVEPIGSEQRWTLYGATNHAVYPPECVSEGKSFRSVRTDVTKLSQREAAERLGIPVRDLRRLEGGE